MGNTIQSHMQKFQFVITDFYMATANPDP